MCVQFNDAPALTLLYRGIPAYFGDLSGLQTVNITLTTVRLRQRKPTRTHHRLHLYQPAPFGTLTRPSRYLAGRYLPLTYTLTTGNPHAGVLHGTTTVY